MRRILCLFGRHRRSRGHVVQHGAAYVSKCKHCGRAMSKAPRSAKWKVMRETSAEGLPSSS